MQFVACATGERSRGLVWEMMAVKDEGSELGDVTHTRWYAALCFLLFPPKTQRSLAAIFVSSSADGTVFEVLQCPS